MRINTQLRCPYVGLALVFITVMVLYHSHLLLFAQPAVSSENHILSIAWSPDASQVALGYQGGRIEIVSLISPTVKRTLQESTSLSDVYALAWSPDGQMLASGTSRYVDRFTIWNVAIGEAVLTEDQMLEDILTIIWSPSSTQVLVTAAEPRKGGFSSILINITSAEIVGVPVAYVVSTDWTANASKFVVGTAPGQIIVLDAASLEFMAEFNIDSVPFRRLINQPVEVIWNPDGTRLAVGMGDGRVLILSNESPHKLELVTTLIAHEYEGSDYLMGFVHDLLYTSDGSQLTSVSGDGTIRTWDTNTWEIIADGLTVPSYAAEFTPYGGRLALGVVLGMSDAPQPNAPVVQTFVEGQVQIIVPAPSFDRLNAIAELCVRDAPTRTRAVTGLASQRVTSLDALPDFVAQVESLPEGAIPAACRADLLAVADALR